MHLLHTHVTNIYFSHFVFILMNPKKKHKQEGVVIRCFTIWSITQSAADSSSFFFWFSFAWSTVLMTFLEGRAKYLPKAFEMFLKSNLKVENWWRFAFRTAWNFWKLTGKKCRSKPSSKYFVEALSKGEGLNIFSKAFLFMLPQSKAVKCKMPKEKALKKMLKANLKPEHFV